MPFVARLVIATPAALRHENLCIIRALADLLDHHGDLSDVPLYLVVNVDEISSTEIASFDGARSHDEHLASSLALNSQPLL